MPTFFDEIIGISREALRSGLEGVTVSLKTNYGPEINIPINGSGEAGNALGIRGGLIIRNRSGEVIETVGDPAPTEPLKFGLLVVVLSAGLFVIGRGVLKR